MPTPRLTICVQSLLCCFLGVCAFQGSPLLEPPSPGITDGVQGLEGCPGMIDSWGSVVGLPCRGEASRERACGSSKKTKP